MKNSIIAAGICAAVGFVGMHLYLRMQGAERESPKAEVEAPARPAEEEVREKPKPKSAPAPAKVTTPSRPAPKLVTAVSEKPRKRPAGMYYTVPDLKKNGLPGRVRIHNTPVGDRDGPADRSGG